MVKKNFLDLLRREGILGDGAIGTEIYNRGVFINRCYDELNLTKPDLIKQIHREYISSGSQLIKTNTFTANRAALASYGLEDRIKVINKAGVDLARSEAANDVFVAGSVGPVSSSTSKNIVKREWFPLFAEQIAILADAGVDVILLETFTNLDELDIAISAAKDVSSLPIISHVSVKRIDENEYAGFTPEEAAGRMERAGADVIGVNCADGPQGVFDAIKRMADVVERPLSAMPNAGMPKMIQGRMLYLATPEYMAEYARRYAQLGVLLIGGCCGTTPAHIREMKHFLSSIKPRIRVEVEREYINIEAVKREPISIEKRSFFGSKLGKKFLVSVEIDPPLGIDPSKAVEGAKFLKDLGVDVVNIADGPRAVPRMSPIALGEIIQKKADIEVIVHYCCRDRNVLGMQMDLLGANALGLNNILIITGDPPKMGYYPDATPVFDMDSIGLIHFASNMNKGLDFSNRPMKERTSLVIGCGCNPGAVDIDLEVERLFGKVKAGAEFIFSQPVYDLEIFESFLNKVKSIGVPFFIGILPISSLKNAEFLHNEVPGMQIPKAIMNRIRSKSIREEQQRIGVEVAKEIFDYSRENNIIQGAYIFPPFGRYNLVEDIVGD